ncbi:MAG: DUF6174 domain-containing protein [Nostoc sp.]
MPNYSYEFTRNCNCLPKATELVIIQVRNGVTTSITSKETGKPVDAQFFKNTILFLNSLISLEMR